MPSLKYSIYPGFGEWANEHLNYSQAVRVGDTVQCSGQGGWTFVEGQIGFPSDLAEEIDQAFRNVETALKAAGAEGWTQVYRVNSYHTVLTPEATARMVENYKKYMPGHKPIWTQIGVAKLGADEMRVEIEVSAFDPEGAKKSN